MSWKPLTLLLVLCQTLSCREPVTPPIQPTPTVQQPLWSLPRANGGGAYGQFPQFIYRNTLITYTAINQQANILALDKESGQELWRWSDTFDKHEATTQGIHVLDSIMVWRRSSRVYAINLNSGKTVWRERVTNNVGYGTSDITGLGNRFFFHSARVTYFSGLTRTGNISTGPILMHEGNTNTVISCPPQMFLNAPPNFVPQANLNDTLVILSHTTDKASVYNLYNLTQDKIHYTKTMIGDSSGVFGLLPSIHNGKVYFPSGLFVLCFDLKTGNEVWRTEFSSVFFGVGPVIHNNKMYCNNNDGFSYCLDPETGKILWKTRTRGGTSLPFYLNGVVYFTSIADGHLYGLDAETGSILMKIDDPRGGIGFGDMVAGADGKIYANTYTHLYCFKAAR